MIRMNRTARMAAILAAIALGTAACGGATSDPTAGSDKGGDGGPLSVGVTIHQADVYFQAVADQVEKEAKADGGKATLVNTETNAATEATGFQNFITAQVDGIVTSPLSAEGSLASVKLASKAGIPTVCYNTCVGDDSEKYVAAFIESDQKDLGTQTGALAAQHLKDAGKTSIKLGMLNCNRYEACKDRQNGFLEALEAGGITVKTVADQEALAPDEATKKATDIMTANPDLDVMWGSSQGSTEGIVAAVKAAGKADSIALFGTDVSKTLVQSIKSGDLVAITGQDSVKTGELAVDYIKKAIAGEEITPFQVKIPGVLYAAGDAATLDDYIASH